MIGHSNLSAAGSALARVAFPCCMGETAQGCLSGGRDVLFESEVQVWTAPSCLPCYPIVSPNTYLRALI